jgi:hypothetical protein
MWGSQDIRSGTRCQQGNTTQPRSMYHISCPFPTYEYYVIPEDQYKSETLSDVLKHFKFYG